MTGMDDEEDETNFSDDGLDDLEGNALQELEQNAIQSTQQPTKQAYTHGGHIDATRGRNGTLPGPYQQHHAHTVDDDFDTEGFDAEAYDNGRVATPVEEPESCMAARRPGEMTQREDWRQARFGQRQQQPPQRVVQQYAGPVRPLYKNPAPASLNYQRQDGDYKMQDSAIKDVQPEPQTQSFPSEREEAFQARIAELLKERDSLTKELRTTTDEVWTRRGEISNLRARQEKNVKVYERQLNSLQKSMQEENAKNKAAIAAQNEENARIADAQRRLQHDLDEEAAKSRRLQIALKQSRGAQSDDQVTTPKKPARPLGDAFDDGDLMVVSPARSGRASKGGTPTAGGKRKRKIDHGSPMPPLVLLPSELQAREEPQTTVETKTIPVRIRKDVTAEKNLKFIQRVMNHHLKGGQERIVEKFTQFSFPSQPSRLFSSIVLDATAGLRGASLPSDLLQTFISLWSQSLREKYYKPISIFIDVAQFIVALESSTVTVSIVSNLLPVLQQSAEINGVIRFNNAKAVQTAMRNKQVPQTELVDEANSTDCLELLYSVASVCHEGEKTDRFWRSLSTDFVLLFLSISQPISDITIMLDLLSTSIRPTTFGNICGTPADQATAEKYIIDRVTHMLWETPNPGRDATPYTRPEITQLRIEAVALLMTLALNSPHPHTDPAHHGSALLAHHSHAIGRLVRCMYEELDLLYLHLAGHELHAHLVNETTRLVFHLLQLHGDNIDLQTKLQVINGGVHKHRVVLTRLAFSEGVFLDKGVEDETVLMAHDMLEEAVTPEEAEALLEVFPQFKGRKADSQDDKS